MVRAEQEQVDACPVLIQPFGDVLMHPGDVIDSIQATRDPGLVRHDCHGDVGPVELGDRLGSPINELNAIDGAHISVINDDRAIAIEQDSWS
jgi:hypothetical protein